MDRKLFLIGGISALVYAVVMAVVAAYTSSVLGPPTTPAREALQNWAEASAVMRWLEGLGTLDWLLAIPIALALYFGLRNREPSYAVLGLVATLVGATVALVSFASGPTLSWKLSQAYAAGSSTEMTAALLIAESVGRWSHLAGFGVGLIAAALGIGLFGLAMLKSQAFPRWLGWVGIVGGGLSLIGQISWFVTALVVIMFISWVAMLAWIFLAGIYLLKIKSATT